MNRVHVALITASVLFATTSCTSDSPTIDDTVVEADAAETPRIREETWIVGPELADCVGEAEQMCMLVKDDPEDEWELFYDSIFGFEFTPGVTSTLRVEISEVDDPPADASSERYELLDVIDQQAQ